LFSKSDQDTEARTWPFGFFCLFFCCCLKLLHNFAGSVETLVVSFALWRQDGIITLPCFCRMWTTSPLFALMLRHHFLCTRVEWSTWSNFAFWICVRKQRSRDGMFVNSFIDDGVSLLCFLL
jgi:hypothetical protein